MASLVYGFIRAAEEGWRDGLTLGSFGAGVGLLFGAVKAGIAFLRVTVAIAVGAGLSQRFLPALGPKPSC